MKKIKKSQLALGIMALTIISTIGISSVTLASSPNTGNATSTAAHLRINRMGHWQNKNENKTNRATETAKRTAVSAALKANDYNAWVKAVGPNAPILQKINASNFSRFVEAYNLRQQADTIMTELGVNKGLGMGMGGHFELNN